MNEQKEQHYDLQIEFPDGSQPVNHYCMTLEDIIEVLGEWNKNWIIRPGNYDKNTNIWTMYAEGRKENGMSWPEFWESNGRELIYTREDHT